MCCLINSICSYLTTDTFGNLREIQAEELRLKTSFCFICGLPKDVFDTRANNAAVKGGTGGSGSGSGGGQAQREQLNFSGHIKREHHMWDYLFYLVYLKAKPVYNYNGMESHIASLVENDDFSWIPVGVSSGVANGSSSGSGESSSEEAEGGLLASAISEISLKVQASNSMKSDTKELRALIQNLTEDVTQFKSELEAVVSKSKATVTPSSS